ncbi:putative cargo transport protein EMP24 (p24 protein family) [Handroanthus impetiginosus]|uniref:Putative cargo transport protein EMP24 (p24 protein family) n=1 Tax=Handroanthus impetiginosus TaxID=429701 RepID=A0A2G9GF68_9LAMI|nr:putative cargo transport protein EMP24 (p24 protein family) [Handroanthus impetiginosus]
MKIMDFDWLIFDEKTLLGFSLLFIFICPVSLLTKDDVTSAYGNSYHHADNVNEGHFAFQAVEAGDYMACFFAADHKPSTTLTIDFDWKSGVAAKDWSNVAKKGSVELMELELKKMFDTVQSIHDEMFYLREREEEMQQLNVSTNSKMAWLSFLSLVVSLSVAGLQLWHLKSFFEKKKLI